ncbi:hypothetical protein LEP1GSC082_1296 [Leptospira kirschneri str. H2]|nr:hypothetical protein LEP1GSC082_1296 [Leptospira kirschneri str. H2]
MSISQINNYESKVQPVLRPALKSLLEISERILTQSKNSKNKIYSIHAPEVECISKGKSHKRYEFGCKVTLVTTSKSNWIVGVQALHDNPYDGHTLKDAINQMEKIVGLRPKEVYVDLEPVSKLVVLLTRNYLFVKWTNIIQRYRMGFGNK